MKRTWLNFLIDGITAVCGIGIVWTGLLLYFILPPGSGRSGGALFKMTRHEWGDWHFYFAMAGLALIVIHIVLHWQWVCVMVCRCVPGGSKGSPRRSRRMLAGILAMVLFGGMLAGSLYWASTSVQTVAHDQQEGGQGYRGGRGGGAGGGHDSN